VISQAVGDLVMSHKDLSVITHTQKAVVAAADLRGPGLHVERQCARHVALREAVGEARESLAALNHALLHVHQRAAFA